MLQRIGIRGLRVLRPIVRPTPLGLAREDKGVCKAPALTGELECWLSDPFQGPQQIVPVPLELFGQPIRTDLLQKLVQYERALDRLPSKQVKTRAMVRGGGKKPWKQKGTGRARAGSIRSPLWRGGGKAHGPVFRSFAIDINKKAKRLALKILLSTKFREDNIVLWKDTKFPQPKSKVFAPVLKSLGTDSILVIDSQFDENFLFAARNFPHVEFCRPTGLTAVTGLRKDKLVITLSAIEELRLYLSADKELRQIWKDIVNPLTHRSKKKAQRAARLKELAFKRKDKLSQIKAKFDARLSRNKKNPPLKLLWKVKQSARRARTRAAAARKAQRELEETQRKAKERLGKNAAKLDK